MENISNLNNFEEEKEQETIQASYVNNGDTIYLGGIKFEVIDADSQSTTGRVKIKNGAGEESYIDSFQEVQIDKKEEDQQLAA